MKGRRRDVVPADRLSRSVTQQTESGSSNSAESSRRNSFPPPIARQLLARPAKRLRSSTIQTTAYTEPEMEADGQGHMEPVRLSDDISDEYQMSHPGDKTEPDTEPEGAHLGGADETTPRRRRGPRLVETHGNNRPRSVRISSLPGDPSTRGTVSVRHVINSRRNMVTGVEGEILGVAKDLMLQYTLYVNPLPNPVALTSEVHSVSSRAQDEIEVDAGNIEPLSKTMDIVSQRSQP